MKNFILVLTCTAMVSCGGWVDPKEWAVYEELCKPNGGIESVQKWAYTTLHCKNGAIFSHETTVNAMEVVNR